MSKVLLLYAHPSQHKSNVNAPMFELAKSLDFVTAVDLYAQYPRFNIDINVEQQRLLEHDVIIFQFPFYWYSTPAILKEWLDLVLEFGFAYGDGGAALKGKYLICAVSAGGSEQAYCSKGSNHYTINELLRPLEQTARLTQMHFLPPFALYRSLKSKDDGRLQTHLQKWQEVLEGLNNGTLLNPHIGNQGTINCQACNEQINQLGEQ